MVIVMIATLDFGAIKITQDFIFLKIFDNPVTQEGDFWPFSLIRYLLIA